MKWKISSASARGSSHVRSGKPNQDACEYGTGSKEGPLRAVLAVSDGHGGARHFRSEVGSRLAVHVAVMAVQELVEDPTGAFSEEDARFVTARVVERWRNAVASDLEHNPFRPEELAIVEAAEGSAARDSVLEAPVLAYGATLLVTIAADTFVAYLQLGDGDILAVAGDGETRKPVPSDARLIGNQTTSLCQPDAVADFRIALERDPDNFPVMVLASTDGYSNSFQSEKGFLQTGRDYLKMVREVGLDALGEDLPSILEEASKEGSGDDITLGLLVSDRAYADVVVAPPVVEARTPEAPGPAPEKRSQKVRLLSLLALVLVGAFAAQRYSGGFGARAGGKETPAVPKPVVAAAPPAKVEAAKNVPSEGRVYALQGLEGKALQLPLGTVVHESELFGLLTGKVAGGTDAYAEVAADAGGNLTLVNQSADVWRHGDAKVKHGEAVELAKDLRVTFRKGAAGHIILMAAASEQ